MNESNILRKCIPALTAFLLMVPVNSAWSENEIIIGWIGPLSGPSAVLGVDSVEVAKQAFDEINTRGGIAGHKIKFIAEDDQYVTAKTVTSYRRLANVERAQVIFVLTYGGIKAVAASAERDNVLLLDPLDCDDELAALPPNSFCIAKRTEDLGIQNARHAVNNQQAPAAIVYFDADPFPIKVANSTKQALESAGAKVVLFEGISTGATADFRSLLTAARQKQIRSLFVYGNDDFGLAFKQAKDIGLNCAFYSVPGAGLGSPGFDSSAGEAINGIFSGGWFAPRTAEYRAFRENYKTKVGRYPYLDVSTVPTYDIARFLVPGLELAVTAGGKQIEIAKLRDYLYGLKDYRGLSGTITIDPDGGVRTLKIGMYQYNNGDFQAVGAP